MSQLDEKKLMELAAQHALRYNEDSLSDSLQYIVNRAKVLSENLERLMARKDYSLEEKARQMLHEVLWAVPNMNHDSVMSKLSEYTKSKAAVDIIQRMTDLEKKTPAFIIVFEDNGKENRTHIEADNEEQAKEAFLDRFGIATEIIDVKKVQK